MWESALRVCGGDMLSGMPEARDPMPMGAISSGRELSSDPEKPDLTGKVAPTGLPLRPLELICRRPSPFRIPENELNDMLSAEGDGPSEPEFR